MHTILLLYFALRQAAARASSEASPHPGTCSNMARPKPVHARWTTRHLLLPLLARISRPLMRSPHDAQVAGPGYLGTLMVQSPGGGPPDGAAAASVAAGREGASAGRPGAGPWLAAALTLPSMVLLAATLVPSLTRSVAPRPPHAPGTGPQHS